MSISSLQSSIERTQRELADLQKQASQETKNESDKIKRINTIQSSINNNTTLTTLSSKLQEIGRLQDDSARIQGKKADIGRKISDKTKQLHQYQKDLAREQDSERRKVEEAEKRRQREQLSHQRAITSELAQQRKLAQQLKDASKSSGRIRAEEEIYDVFISHASEDKEEFVRPLTQELESQGFKVWYDELTLKVGDSLRQSIDRGLAGSRYGVVVLSSAFFSKNWPQYELNGLTAREMDGAKVILPIWHKVSKNEVMQYSPTLADKVALNSSVNSVEEIANQLAEVLKDE
jgi:hypothetical protein